MGQTMGLEPTTTGITILPPLFINMLPKIPPTTTTFKSQQNHDLTTLFPPEKEGYLKTSDLPLLAF